MKYSQEIEDLSSSSSETETETDILRKKEVLRKFRKFYFIFFNYFQKIFNFQQIFI